MHTKRLLMYSSIAICLIASCSISAQELGCGTVVPQSQIDYELERLAAGIDYSLPRLAVLADSVPLTIHIVRSSSGTGGLSVAELDQSMIDLNSRYVSMNISLYVLGLVDYIDDDNFYSNMATMGQINALRQVNPVCSTINIYFVPDASSFPYCGLSSFTSSSVQGIVMNNDCSGTSNPSTLAHEIGHYFDLYHTHETVYGVECPDGSNCTVTGDLLCDTPADPILVVDGYYQLSPYPDCEYNNYAETPAGCGGIYHPDTRNMMSYSGRKCRDFFSEEQISKAVYTLNYEREELFNGCASAETRAIVWDTISTGCTDLIVGNKANFGYGSFSPGVSLDYVGYGDCDPNADVYVYGASTVIGYLSGSTRLSANSFWGNNGFTLVVGGAETVPTVTTSEYDWFSTGTLITNDSMLALEQDWYAPKAIDNCEFVIKKLKIYSFDGEPHAGLHVASAIDFNIPTSSSGNSGGYDATDHFVYQKGEGTSGCQPNDNRFGGVALIDWYTDSTSLNGHVPYGGCVDRNDLWVYPAGGFVEEQLYDQMVTTGYSVNGSNTDLYTLLTHVGNYDLSADDTLIVFAVVSTVQNGNLDHLKTNITKARTWVGIHLLPDQGCCGLWTGQYTGNTDCDTDGKRNLADITRLIDNVYISKVELCCVENGNVEGDPEGKINLADITKLIDHVYISKGQTAVCN